MGVDIDMDVDMTWTWTLTWPFSFVSVCFEWSMGVLVISKRAVSILERFNRNKRYVLDSAETIFGSSFGYIETNLIS
jgi:hypothetical protein